MKRNLFILILVLASVLLYGTNERFFVDAKEYYIQGDYDKAEELLFQAMEKTTVLPEHHYYLGKTYIAQQKYDLAYEHLSIYKEKNLGANEEEITAVLEILQKQIELAKTEKNIYTLGKIYGKINSEYSDFAPVIANNGKTLYLTSGRLADQGKENIYEVNKIDGIWQEPHMIDNLNTKRNESLGAVNASNDVAYLFGNYLSNSKNGDIYLTRKNDNGWEKPSLIAGVNSDNVEIQPYVFENVMFFASNRPGGYGALDLYVSVYTNGSWSTPENLGDVINTDEYEETPFLDWDGNTLYFASNGHPGLGGFDIFKAEKIGDTWQEWSEPENLGLVVNSVKDDRYFYNSPFDNTAFISSNRFSGLGHEDIYHLTIRPIEEEIVEEPVVEVLTEDTQLEEMEVDEVIIIDNINFDFDSAELLEDSYPILDFLAEKLMENTQLTVEISGHTDNIGAEEYNQNLSQTRAESVVNYLVEKGISAENLIPKGVGEVEPIASNDTEEGRFENRRVEMKIVDIEEELIEE